MNRSALVVITAVMVATATALVTWSVSTREPGSGRPTYWIAPSGSDTADGSEGSPWRTIQHAASTVPPGSTVFVRAGVYNEQVHVLVSGNRARDLLVRQHIGRPILAVHDRVHPVLWGRGVHCEAPPSGGFGLLAM